MSDQENTETFEDDVQLEEALSEYADTLDDSARKAFIAKLHDDKDFHVNMGKALSEMAMLIAGAAVIDDESEYSRLRRKVLFESRQDDEGVFTMRIYYLNNRHAVEMEAILDGDDEKSRYEERMQSFLDDYKQQHSYKA